MCIPSASYDPNFFHLLVSAFQRSIGLYLRLDLDALQGDYLTVNFAQLSNLRSEVSRESGM
jgi:hypothetical protein